MNSALRCIEPGSETIAIIEHDTETRSHLARLLSVMGYDIELYDGPEAFLKNIDRCRAGCLIIDVRLGSMSGLELAQHPDVAALKLPIILDGGNDDAAMRTLSQMDGYAALLRKPYTATELLAALVRASEHRPTLVE